MRLGRTHRLCAAPSPPSPARGRGRRQQRPAGAVPPRDEDENAISPGDFGPVPVPSRGTPPDRRRVGQVGSAAERGRCRWRRASPPPMLVDVGLPRRGGRPISPGSASGMSGDRGSGGDGRAERGWTARCYCRGTRAPPRPAGTVPRPEGRAEGIPRPVVSAAVGARRESSVMPP